VIKLRLVFKGLLTRAHLQTRSIATAAAADDTRITAKSFPGRPARGGFRRI